MTRNRKAAASTGKQTIDFVIELPKDYRLGEVLDFHDRDPEGRGEVVGADSIRKGIMHGGNAVALSIHLENRRAVCRVEVDGLLDDATVAVFPEIARKMLGLAVDPVSFEELAEGDDWFRPLLHKQRGLRIPQAATPFEALTWAVMGQQVHLEFAITLRRTLMHLAGKRHSCGLWCYPEASDVACLDLEELCRRKFSRAKAQTVVRIAQLVEGGDLPLDEWQNGDPAEIERGLLQIKGIGPWTTHYTLLRGYGFADCSLHGDAAIRTAIQRLQGLTAKPSMEETRKFLDRYRPYRSMAAAHLWGSLRRAE